MSTIKSSDEHLTLNADGSSKDIKFQANGVEKASISSSGAFTSTTIDATKLTGDLPAISGANLTGISSVGGATGVDFNDNVKARFGTNNDLEIYHDHANSQNVQLSTSIPITFAANDLKFANGLNDTLLMKIDNDGHITAPKQPAFLVNARQSASNIAVNANTTAQFTEEVYDVNADYNTSTYTFTAPVTGKYQFNVSLLWMNWDASANYYYLKLVTSNRTYYELFNGGERSSDVTYAYGHIHVLADMDANDTAYVELFQNSGAQQTYYENQSVFGGYLAC
jgi:hypothetical protein